MAGKKTRKALIPAIAERVEDKIYVIRGQRVMLDADIAELYGVETANLNKAVKRNIERFPQDFMFQLTKEECANLRFQFGISSSMHGGRRYMPFAFTEQGVAMLSSVLRSSLAVQMNIAIMRAFVRMREALGARREFDEKFAAVEARLAAQDTAIRGIVDAIQHLMALPLTEPDEPESDDPDKPPMGFRVKEGAAKYHRRRRNATSRKANG